MSRSQTDKRTHTAPHTRTPPPRLGRERDERMEQPEGGDKNTYGRVKVAASRCPAPRDSPALARQEGDDWPHTPFITLPLRRLPFPPTLSLTSTSRRPLIPRPARPRSSPPRSHTHTRA